ncbi:MAG: hypothetical protein WDN72_00815 [Alphaproteobacteria bacterium]
MSQLTSSQQQAVDFAVLTQLSVEAKGDRIKTMILNTAMENHPSDVPARFRPDPGHRERGGERAQG